MVKQRSVEHRDSHPARLHDLEAPAARSRRGARALTRRARCRHPPHRLKTAKAFGLDPPIPLLARTAKVIEEEPALLQCITPGSAQPIGALRMTLSRRSV